LSDLPGAAANLLRPRSGRLAVVVKDQALCEIETGYPITTIAGLAMD
jgi:hypothetical protein